VVTAYVRNVLGLPVVARRVLPIYQLRMSVFTKAFSPAVREIRILFSQTGPASAGTRSAQVQAPYPYHNSCNPTLHRAFVVSKYPVIKKHNPDLPVMIREATGTPARVFARFGKSLPPFNAFALLMTLCSFRTRR
jgi:NADH dehydrogenase (ubiquinone) 1 alpha subcomplex subunit 2